MALPGTDCGTFHTPLLTVRLVPFPSALGSATPPPRSHQPLCLKQTSLQQKLHHSLKFYWVVVCVSPARVYAMKVRSLVLISAIAPGNTCQGCDEYLLFPFHLFSPSWYTLFETFHRLLAPRIKSELYFMACNILLDFVPARFPKLTQYAQWFSHTCQGCFQPLYSFLLPGMPSLSNSSLN